MPAINIRGMSEEMKRALRVRAAQHGRSMEAEARAILEQAVFPQSRLRLGSALVDIFKPFGGIPLDVERDRTPAEPADFN